MSFTEAEAAEIAAECVSIIDWQTEHFIQRKDTDTFDAVELVDAVTPKSPATLRMIEAMKFLRPARALRGLAPSGAPQRIVLMPTTCRSIAQNLSALGFKEAAAAIIDALDRGDSAAAHKH